MPGGKKASLDVFKAAVQRIDEQLAQVKQNAANLEERRQSYLELQGLLQELPEKLSHPVMVPFGPLAFFPGQVVHTNEVLTQLSSEWFAMRTCKNALGTVQRRLRRIDRDKQDVAKELREIGLRRRLASGEHAEPEEAVPEVPGATVRVDEDGYLDIREPLDFESGGEVASSCAGGSQAAAPGAQVDTLARLRELERLEEEEEASGALEGLDGAIPECDELSELDRIMELYQEQPPEAASKVEEKPQKPSEPVAAHSPADLFTLMSRASAPDAQPVEEPEDHLAAKGFSSLVRERDSPAPPAPAPAPAESKSAEAPKRISKFKAERQASGKN